MNSLRISDADREAAVTSLGEHYALGRLDKAELDERCDAVWSAKTRGDLAPVFADLPGLHPPGGPTHPSHLTGVGRAGSFPIVPVLVVLGVITVVTHLPFVLLGVALWFFWIRPRQSSQRWPQDGYVWPGPGPGAGAGAGSKPWRRPRRR